jgi:Ca2+-binding RTX toxin-like protein
MRIRILGLAAFALAVAVPAAAQNLVLGGTFRSTVDGWDLGDVSALTFDYGSDADGSPASGGGRIVNAGADDANPVLVARCIGGLIPGEEYFLDMKVAFQALEAKTGLLNVGVTVHDTPDCTGAGAGGIDPARGRLSTARGRGKWRRLGHGDVEHGFVAGPGAKSAKIYVHLIKWEAGGRLTVGIDDVVLAPVGTEICLGAEPTIRGTDGPDILDGTPGKDVIAGLGGDDVIRGGGGPDIICGGPGNDDIDGGEDGDLLFGDAGADDIRGGEGDDVLLGGSGPDALDGEGGTNALRGGAGKDACPGSLGDAPNVPQCEVLIAP